MGASLSGTTTRNAVSGVASFTDLSLDKAGGGYTLIASAAGLSAATSATFNMTAGAATKLVFSTQPGNAAAGAPIAGPMTVTVQDNAGKTVTSSTIAITATLGTNPASGTLSGTLTKNAVAGIAMFENLSIAVPCSGID
jgi:hypothetical protein